ncbi:hypothetical protein HK097_008013 [Rhizophlyctis rosea]|uniref:Uncharacterized protein n=1 Tax=Rhizophlyctis rosea TaxID=64517 RepID=A0AAD5X4T9_9FUNG|nr:hypothetical protein HK097_008013 [Rhizophlyctis rosea]
MAKVKVSYILEGGDGDVYTLEIESIGQLKDAACRLYENDNVVEPDCSLQATIESQDGQVISDAHLVASFPNLETYIQHHNVSLLKPVIVTVTQRRKGKRPRQDDDTEEENKRLRAENEQLRAANRELQSRQMATVADPLILRRPPPRPFTPVHHQPLLQLGDLLPPNVPRLPLDNTTFDLTFFEKDIDQPDFRHAVCQWYRNFVFEENSFLRKFSIQYADANYSAILAGLPQLKKTRAQVVLLTVLAMVSRFAILFVRSAGGEDSMARFEEEFGNLGTQAENLIGATVALNPRQQAFFRCEVVRAKVFKRKHYFVKKSEGHDILQHRASPVVVIGRANGCDITNIFDSTKTYRRQPVDNLGTHMNDKVMKFDERSDKRRFGVVFDEGDLTASSPGRSKTITERMIHREPLWGDDGDREKEGEAAGSDEEEADMRPGDILAMKVGVGIMRETAAFVAYTSATWPALLLANPTELQEEFILTEIPFENLDPPYVGFVKGEGVRTVQVKSVTERKWRSGFTKDVWFTDGVGISEMLDELIDDYRRTDAYRSIYISTPRTTRRANQKVLAAKIASEFGSRVPMATFTFFGGDEDIANQIFVTQGDGQGEWFASKEEVEDELYDMFRGHPSVSGVSVKTITRRGGDDDGFCSTLPKFDGWVIDIHGVDARGKTLRVCHFFDVIKKLFEAKGRSIFAIAISGYMGGRGTPFKSSRHDPPLTDLYFNITKGPNARYVYRHFEDNNQISGRLSGRDAVERDRTLWISQGGWEELETALGFVMELTKACKGLERFTLQLAVAEVMKTNPKGSLKEALQGFAEHALTRYDFHKRSKEVTEETMIQVHAEPDGGPATGRHVKKQAATILRVLRDNEGQYLEVADMVNYLAKRGELRNVDENGHASRYDARGVAPQVFVFETPHREDKEIRQLKSIIAGVLNSKFGGRPDGDFEEGNWQYEKRQGNQNHNEFAAFRIR